MDAGRIDAASELTMRAARTIDVAHLPPMRARATDAKESDREMRAARMSAAVMIADRMSVDRKIAGPMSVNPMRDDRRIADRKIADPMSVNRMRDDRRIADRTIVDPKIANRMTVDRMIAALPIVVVMIVDPMTADPMIVEPTIVDRMTAGRTTAVRTIADQVNVDPRTPSLASVDPMIVSMIVVPPIPIAIARSGRLPSSRRRSSHVVMSRARDAEVKSVLRGTASGSRSVTTVGRESHVATSARHETEEPRREPLAGRMKGRDRSRLTSGSSRRSPPVCLMTLEARSISGVNRTIRNPALHSGVWLNSPIPSQRRASRKSRRHGRSLRRRSVRLASHVVREEEAVRPASLGPPALNP